MSPQFDQDRRIKLLSFLVAGRRASERITPSRLAAIAQSFARRGAGIPVMQAHFIGSVLFCGSGARDVDIRLSDRAGGVCDDEAIEAMLLDLNVLLATLGLRGDLSFVRLGSGERFGGARLANILRDVEPKASVMVARTYHPTLLWQVQGLHDEERIWERFGSVSIRYWTLVERMGCYSKIKRMSDSDRHDRIAAGHLDLLRLGTYASEVGPDHVTWADIAYMCEGTRSLRPQER